MSYISLGSRPVKGALDTTTLNQGNFTDFFSAALLDAKVAFYEIYSINVTGLAQVATITGYVSGQLRTTAKLLGNAEWDPSQPILMRDGDDLALCWNFGTGTPPSATVWLRYDPAIQPKA